LGIVLLVVAIILLAPFCLVILAKSGRRAPIAVRLALRDLARYRARSGSALAAISLGVFIAALVCVLTAQRYGNVLDYAGPNLASNQIIVYTPNGGPGGGPGNGPGGSSSSGTVSTPQAQAATAQNIAKALGSSTVIELDQAGASLQHAAAGRSWSGPIYVATGWLIQAPHPPTAAQITDARLTAAAAGLTIETKNSAPSSAEILNWATVFGIALALGILAMSVGLIRSETARDLRTLTATGASSATRRELTAVTAFALALGGAVLGTVAAYV